LSFVLHAKTIVFSHYYRGVRVSPIAQIFPDHISRPFPCENIVIYSASNAVVVRHKTMASTATSADNTQSAIKARRKSKDLPLCLACLTEANFQTQIKARLETDNKDQSGEVMVAY
jgi:hypothetical protein